MLCFQFPTKSVMHRAQAHPRKLTASTNADNEMEIFHLGSM